MSFSFRCLHLLPEKTSKKLLKSLVFSKKVGTFAPRKRSYGEFRESSLAFLDRSAHIFGLKIFFPKKSLPGQKKALHLHPLRKRGVRVNRIEKFMDIL